MMALIDRMMASWILMKRTQIQFREEQLAALRELAASRGESVAAVVRDAVDELILRAPRAGRPERWRRAASVTGAFSSDRTDIAEQHDRYLAEAFESE
ncbi:MAG: ribbon-helix-helix protein, CopG family [Acidobacteriota bacterium]|jgi:hypothetical protein